MTRGASASEEAQDPYSFCSPPSSTQKKDPPRTDGQHQTADTPRVRVLVVDDDEAVRKADAIRLRRLGHEATTCSCPQRALQIIETTPDAVDLVLTDQAMPKMDGLTLAQTIRERGCDIPVVIMSGYSSDLTTANVEAAGVQAVLRKPFGVKEVTAVMEKVSCR